MGGSPGLVFMAGDHMRGSEFQSQQCMDHFTHLNVVKLY